VQAPHKRKPTSLPNWARCLIGKGGGALGGREPRSQEAAKTTPPALVFDGGSDTFDYTPTPGESAFSEVLGSDLEFLALNGSAGDLGCSGKPFPNNCTQMALVDPVVPRRTAHSWHADRENVKIQTL